MNSVACAPARRPLLLAALLASALLVACAPPPRATSSGNELPFEQAVNQASDGLIAQTQKLPAFLARVEARLARRAVVVDPMLDAASGQQTQATQLLERRVSERLKSRDEAIDILPFRSASLTRAQFLLTGTMTRQQLVGQKIGRAHV